VNSNSKECADLDRNFYSIDAQDVDPVFFAVVPDAFMTRGGGDRGRQNRIEAGDWMDVHDTPVLAPRDPWSF
jgi:hypothetical protein